MEKDNHGVSRWFVGLYCMPIIFCLSASAKPRGRKRRAPERREQTRVENDLSHRPGRWARGASAPAAAATVAAARDGQDLRCKTGPKPGPANSPCSFWSQDKGKEGVRKMHLGLRDYRLGKGQEKVRTVMRLGRNDQRSGLVRKAIKSRCERHQSSPCPPPRYVSTFSLACPPRVGLSNERQQMNTPKLGKFPAGSQAYGSANKV